ncbi:hypothetical protein SVAN01_07645 [Stagonosporopsis vannaccii]|nr:hypothetical protein SVAN01_07645 [Stagonosporopsis vannaccii]
MLFNAFTAAAVMAMVVSAAPAPDVTYPGPPVIYKTANNVPAVTATTLAAPVATGGASKAKRDDSCVQQPAGIQHKSWPDTDAAFLKDPYYSNAAKHAITPLGFEKVFTNTQASPNAPGYAGYTLLDSYDVQQCADKCNAISGCTSFNVYFERDPSVDPNAASCSNPPSVTNIKCVWWTSVITTAENVNNGQYRGKFHVVIAGSNGYTGGKYQRGFRIKTDGSKTVMDHRWLQISPGEGAAIALNDNVSFGSIFQLGTDGTLIELWPWPGMAAALASTDGSTQLLTMRGVGEKNVDYIKCTIDNIIVCTSNNNAQAADVCPNRAQSISGLLYFSDPNKIDHDCSQIGLYVDPVQG